MGQFLSQPLTDKVIQYKELDKFSYCLGSMQGYRMTQEDAHSVLFEKINLKDVDDKMVEMDLKIFCIFDGHGGAQSSTYLSEHLTHFLIEELSNSSEHQPKRFKSRQGLIINKIKNAFLKADYELYRKLQRDRNSQSGSTAILGVLVDNKELYSINTGDSRLIASIDGSSKNLSFDHKPNNIGELIRINDAGGTVSFNRVGGVLALSRAFGDFGFKLRQFQPSNYYKEKSDMESDDIDDTTNDNDDNGNDKKINDETNQRNNGGNSNFSGYSGGSVKRLVSEETQVTVEPECICHQITIEDEFIILACDGIWDVFRNQDLINYIRRHLVLGLRLDEITSKLLEHTLTLADQVTGVGFDNMSIIIVAVQLEGETLNEWHQRIKIKIEVEKGLL